MRTKPTWLWMMLLVLMAGCARDTSWKEEVKLSDGRLIVVEREVERVAGGGDLAYGGSGSRPKEARIRIEFPPDSKRIVEWRSTKTDSRLFPEIPLMLDFSDEGVTVVTANPTSATCVTYYKYVFTGDAWAEQRLPDEFPAQAVNLLLKSGPDMPSYVDLATKAKSNDDIRYPKSLRVIGPNRVVCRL